MFVDLDDIRDLERVWAALRWRRVIRDVDPPLRSAILRRCERLDGEVAAPIWDALDELHPGVVLEEWFTTLVPNLPTVGFCRRRRDEVAA
jgi:hypothetical protein